MHKPRIAIGLLPMVQRQFDDSFGVASLLGGVADRPSNRAWSLAVRLRAQHVAAVAGHRCGSGRRYDDFRYKLADYFARGPTENGFCFKVPRLNVVILVDEHHSIRCIFKEQLIILRLFRKGCTWFFQYK